MEGMRWRYDKDRKEWWRESLQYVDRWIIKKIQFKIKNHIQNWKTSTITEFQLSGCVLDDSRPGLRTLKDAKRVAELLDHVVI